MTRTWTMLRVALILIAFTSSAQAADWTGPARAVDGHTLVINGQRLRLSGIEAVGDDRTCYDERYNVFYCGYFSRSYLETLTYRGPVTCSGPEADAHRLPQVRCTIGDLNLNREMVRSGWARVFGSEDYRAEQKLARQDRIGMWSQVPDEWVGPAEALDGTTLIINGLPLHLAGIEAVDDLCYSRNNVLSCGNAAREHLAHLIKDKRVICSGTDTDWYRLPRVYCSADDVNLSRQMVGGGWAKADKSGAYRAEQDLARNRQIGFWQYDPYPSQK